jgi:hypothetical protein
MFTGAEAVRVDSPCNDALARTRLRNASPGKHDLAIANVASTRQPPAMSDLDVHICIANQDNAPLRFQ